MSVARNKKMLLAVLLSALLVAALFSACAPEEAAEPTPDEEDDKYGGHLRFGSEGDVNYMMPVQEISVLDAVVNSWLFDQVIVIGEEGEPEPQLATHWEISEDETLITFHLKEDVKWHDGEPLTAHDVEFTIYTILDPRQTSGHTAYLTSLVGFEELTDGEEPEQKPVEVLDDYTIEIQLKHPDPTFLSLAMDVGIIPRHLLEEEVQAGEDLLESDFNQQPVGAGPFEFVEWRRDERIIFEAFEDYHAGRPYLDSIIYEIIPDMAVLDMSLETDDVDFVRRVQEESLDDLMDAPHVEIVSRSTIGFAGVVFNCEEPPFTDYRVRQAISYAVDLDSMVSEFISKEAEVSSSPFSPVMGWAHNPELEPYPHDPDKALDILAEAGWTLNDDGELVNEDGEQLTFTLQTFDFATGRRQSCVFIQEELHDIGMEVEVEFLETTVLLDKTDTGDFEAAFVAMGGRADPSDIARRFETRNIGAGNTSNYSNEEFDQLAEQGREEMDQSVRQQLYWEMAEILHEESPVLWSYHSPMHHGINRQFEGWVFTPDATGVFKFMHKVYKTN